MTTKAVFLPFHAHAGTCTHTCTHAHTHNRLPVSGGEGHLVLPPARAIRQTVPSACGASSPGCVSEAESGKKPALWLGALRPWPLCVSQRGSEASNPKERKRKHSTKAGLAPSPHPCHWEPSRLNPVVFSTSFSAMPAVGPQDDK